MDYEPPAPAQGRHRLLFLLFKQTGRATAKPPAKRISFQVCYAELVRALPALAAWAEELGSKHFPAPFVRAFVQVKQWAKDHGLNPNPAAGLWVWAKSDEQ